MTGRDLRDFAASIGTNCEVLFQDAQGNLHEITTAIKTRCDGEKAVLMETGEIFGKGQWPLRVIKPPKELCDYMDEREARKVG